MLFAASKFAFSVPVLFLTVLNSLQPHQQICCQTRLFGPLSSVPEPSQGSFSSPHFFWVWIFSLILFLGSQTQPTRCDKCLARRSLPRSWDRIQPHPSRSFSVLQTFGWGFCLSFIFKILFFCWVFFFFFVSFFSCFYFLGISSTHFSNQPQLQNQDLQKNCALPDKEHCGGSSGTASQRLCVPSCQLGSQTSCCFSPNQAGISSFLFFFDLASRADPLIFFFSGATSIEFCRSPSTFVGPCVHRSHQVLSKERPLFKWAPEICRSHDSGTFLFSLCFSFT